MSNCMIIKTPAFPVKKITNNFACLPTRMNGLTMT
jgi:hypothetical protein